MRAAVLSDYGAPQHLVVQEVQTPRPKGGEVLVRVYATTVSRGDTELRTLDVPWLFRLPLRLWLGLRRPREDTVLGMEFAGVVESVGEGVTAFVPGDAVFGPCGMSLGGYADFVCVPVSGILVRKPEGVSFTDAAALSVGGMAALGYLKRAKVRGARRVLIRGASGSIGSFAVQLAKYFGAHVTGICPPQSVELVRRLGADAVIDYTTQDFSATREPYDLMLDVVGGIPMRRCLAVLRDGGRYVRATIPGLAEVFGGLWTRMTSRKRVIMGDHGESAEDLMFLADLVERGELETVVDRVYPLDDIVQAHGYVEEGHKQGNVIIDLQRGTKQPG
jgi:NADPH:quinone reductase-like Zn-dependent oxidoreductase